MVKPRLSPRLAWWLVFIAFVILPVVFFGGALIWLANLQAAASSTGGGGLMMAPLPPISSVTFDEKYYDKLRLTLANFTNIRPSVEVPEWSQWRKQRKTATQKDKGSSENSGPAIDAAEKRFGFGFLDNWASEVKMLCGQEGTGASKASTLTGAVFCGTMTRTDLPASSHPHVTCTVKDAALNLHALTPAYCPKHRPDYRCESKTYIQYAPGALSVKGGCGGGADWDFDEEGFPKDHLRDIFSSFSPLAQVKDPTEAVAGSQVPLTGSPVVFYTREVGEHCNLWHTVTDWLNVYSSLYMHGMSPARAQLVLLDSHPASPFDMYWKAMFSSAKPMIRPLDIQTDQERKTTGGDVTLMATEALFPPAGYASFLYTDLHREGKNKDRLQLLCSFSAFVRRALGVRDASASIDTKGTDQKNNRLRPLRVVFISRRPATLKDNHGKEHGSQNPQHRVDKQTDIAKIDRQIANEPEIKALVERSGPNGVSVEVTIIDTARLSLPEQIALMQNTDVLLGMHGAGLTLLLFLPPTAAVVEVWPRGGQWRCFEHMAHWMGVGYFRARNRDDSRWFASRSGWSLMLNEKDLQPIVVDALLHADTARRGG